MKQITAIIRDAVTELAGRNARTADKVAKEMFLGPDLLVVRLVEPKVVEGRWEDVPTSRTADIFDLMDDYQVEHQAGRGGKP